MNGVFCWCLLLFCLFTYYIDWVNTTGKAGPYKAKAVRAEACSRPSLRMDKDPPVTLDMQVYNTSTKYGLLRGDINVIRDNWTLKLKLKNYIWTNNKWKLTYLINNVGCNGVLLEMFLKLMNVPFNMKRCVVEKGHYHIEGYDIDVVNHLMVSKAEYGRMLWRAELLSSSSTYFCYEFETVTLPLD